MFEKLLCAPADEHDPDQVKAKADKYKNGGKMFDLGDLRHDLRNSDENADAGCD
ncbi:MAG: hypothetical protein WAV08_00950 [Desulfobacterales bacterium]|nr:hypothetical protein [Desulfobacterales bacterium]